MPARIQLPAQARKGDVIEIRVLIQHAMETGYRVDAEGRNIKRNVIHTVTCRYDGEEIFKADTSSGISANPYFQFTTIAQASGTIEFTWIDDAGVQESERQQLVVSG